MIIQPLRSITVGNVKRFSGEYRFKLTKLVAMHYKLHNRIRYLIVIKSGGRKVLEKQRTDHRQTTKQVLCKMFQKERHET
jgi:predicted kinase